MFSRPQGGNCTVLQLGKQKNTDHRLFFSVLSRKLEVLPQQRKLK